MTDVPSLRDNDSAKIIEKFVRSARIVPKTGDAPAVGAVYRLAS